MTTSGVSLMDEIKKIEDSISRGYERVYLLKSKLKSKNLTTSQKDTLEKELLEVEKLLTTNKTILKKIHTGHRKTFLAACLFSLMIFMLWMIYHLTFGDSTF